MKYSHHADSCSDTACWKWQLADIYWNWQTDVPYFGKSGTIQFDQTTQLEPEISSPLSPDSETLSTVLSICPPEGLLPRRPPDAHRTLAPATWGLTTGSKPTPLLPVHVVKPLRTGRGKKEELKGEWWGNGGLARLHGSALADDTGHRDKNLQTSSFCLRWKALRWAEHMTWVLYLQLKKTSHLNAI